MLLKVKGHMLLIVVQLLAVIPYSMVVHGVPSQPHSTSLHPSGRSGLAQLEKAGQWAQQPVCGWHEHCPLDRPQRDRLEGGQWAEVDTARPGHD